jgi:hypothetical protein
VLTAVALVEVETDDEATFCVSMLLRYSDVDGVVFRQVRVRSGRCRDGAGPTSADTTVGVVIKDAREAANSAEESPFRMSAKHTQVLIFGVFILTYLMYRRMVFVDI